MNDFTAINDKKIYGFEVSEKENDRYGIYILTIIEMVLENKQFKMKNSIEKGELREQMYFELCLGLMKFNSAKGSSIYSYAYRIGYTAACHYYTNLIKEKDRQKKLDGMLENLAHEYQNLFQEYGLNMNEI